MNDVKVVIGFVIVVFITCKVWNIYVMKQYKKSKECTAKLKCGIYFNKSGKLEIAGTDSDRNGDYDVSKAINKIEMPDSVRIKA